MPDHRVPIWYCGHPEIASEKIQLKTRPNPVEYYCNTLRGTDRCPDPTCPGNDMEGGG